MEYVTSKREVKLLRMQSRATVLPASEQDYSTSSGFESSDFIPFLLKIEKPLKESELKLLQGIHPLKHHKHQPLQTLVLPDKLIDDVEKNKLAQNRTSFDFFQNLNSS